MKRIGIIGGDQRQICVTQFLEEQGWQTETAYLPTGPGQEETAGQLQKVFENCRIVVLPVPVLRKGVLNTCTEHKPDAEQIVNCIKHGHRIFGGCFSKELKQEILRRGGMVYDLMDSENVIKENAVATAEGAIAEAVRSSLVTLRGNRCILTGYGRCGSAIHRCLKSWGCEIVVYDSDADACERAKKAGAVICSRENLFPMLKNTAFIFNTAPSLVWTEELLQELSEKICMLELASVPGGIDRDAAARLGVCVTFLPGLPGRFSPETSGRLFGREILKEIEKSEKRECNR